MISVIMFSRRIQIMKRVFLTLTLVVTLVTVTFAQSLMAFTPPTPPAEAFDVVGQPDLDTSVSSTTSTTMSSASSAVVDRVNHRLFVADSGNERVLVFNLNSQNQLIDKQADFVIGQSDFTSSNSGLDQSTFDLQDGGLVFDEVNNRLFVSDESNYRILVFDTSTITNGMDASYVIGQPDFISSNQVTTASGFNYNESTPSFDPERQWLIVPEYNNSRILIFDVSPGNIANGMDAAFVLGAPDFTTQGGGVSSTRFNFEYAGSVYDPSTKRLYVSDYDNNRVVIFDLTTVTNDEPAIHVLGQADFSSSSPNTAVNRMDTPTALAIDSDNQILYVSDSGNNRVLLFDVNSITNGENAIGVLGQPDFDSSDSLSTSKFSINASSATGMFFDDTTGILYVAEQGDHRVSLWKAGTAGDSDGIDSETEDAGPNGGDGNNDGILDSVQSNVVSYPSPITGQYVTLEVDEECEIQSSEIQEQSALSAQDIAFEYPVGVMSFTLDCGTDGFTTNVRQFFYNLQNDDFTLRKHNPNTGAFFSIDGASVTQDTIDGLQVVIGSYSVTDGGLLDIDGVANSTIVDPAGLGQSILGAPRTGGGGTA